MKKVLFIDRDGTLALEPEDYQLDAFDKLIFYPQIFTYLGKIARELDYTLVMVTNQDGLGTESFPENTFWPVHNLLLKSLEQEGIFFEEILIDRSLPKDGALTRKPKTGMLTKYFDDSQYDLANSCVIGDRLTDIELAKNLNAKGIFITNNESLGANEAYGSLNETIVLKTKYWEAIYDFLKLEQRITIQKRATHETDINLSLNLDGSGKSNISTGIVFFDHMLDQLARHGGMDISLQVKGDLEVDEHHTIEDTAIVLGEAFAAALGNKLGIERYGFCLPMDDCLAEFNREMIGQMPTEMFIHFFKSFSDGAKANLNIKAEGTNEHHKIEAIFKAFAKAIKVAVKRDSDKMILPSTKGSL